MENETEERGGKGKRKGEEGEQKVKGGKEWTGER